MAMQKGENQYTRLKRDLLGEIGKIKARRIVNVGAWEIDPVKGANLLELKGIIQSATAIGYDVRLRLDGDKRIKIEAVEKVTLMSEYYHFSSFTV